MNTDNYKALMKLFYGLQHVSCDSTHHPEENVLTHSLQVFKQARKESDDKTLWVSALFHDFGKLVDSHGHEKESVSLLQDYGYYNNKVFEIISNHMRIRMYLDGKMKKWGKTVKLLENQYFKEIVMLRRFDHMGRVPGKKVYDVTEIAIKLLTETNEACIVCADLGPCGSSTSSSGSCPQFKSWREYASD